MPAAIASRVTFLKTFSHPVKSCVWRRKGSEEVLHTSTSFPYTSGNSCMELSFVLCAACHLDNSISMTSDPDCINLSVLDDQRGMSV